MMPLLVICHDAIAATTVVIIKAATNWVICHDTITRNTGIMIKAATIWVIYHDTITRATDVIIMQLSWLFEWYVMISLLDLLVS